MLHVCVNETKVLLGRLLCLQSSYKVYISTGLIAIIVDYLVS